MIPRIIHQVWIGQTIPEHLQPYMASVRRAAEGMGCEYILWGNDNVSSIGLDIDNLTRYTPSIAADVVRLHAVYWRGGIYLDTDVEAVKPFDCLFGYEAWAARQSDGLICNAAFGAVAGHPWIKAQVDQESVLLASGPAHSVHLMSQTPVRGRPLTLIPTEWVFSWAWDSPDSDKVVHPDAMLVHHWDGSWL